jgi:cyanophycin synthetase
MFNLSSLDITTRLVVEKALKRGYKPTFFEGDKRLVFLEINNSSVYIYGSRSSFQSSVGVNISKSKFLTKQVLIKNDIPTAKAVYVKNETDLKKINSLSFPLVMKPNCGSQGKGVVIGIDNFEEAKSYFLKNEKTDYNHEGVIFEELLIGEDYRILCIDGKFVAASSRKAAFVVGDGDHSIAELIDLKNQHPWRGENNQSPLSKIKIDELLLKYLEGQKLTLESVPKLKQEVLLRKTSNVSTGGEPRAVTNLVCKENIELFEKVSKVCDLAVVGIDVMCADLSKSILEQEGSGIVEVNSTPSLRMHHYPLQGEPVDAASLILDMIEKKLTQR